VSLTYFPGSRCDLLLHATSRRNCLFISKWKIANKIQVYHRVQFFTGFQKIYIHMTFYHISKLQFSRLVRCAILDIRLILFVWTAGNNNLKGRDGSWIWKKKFVGENSIPTIIKKNVITSWTNSVLSYNILIISKKCKLDVIPISKCG